MNTAQERAYLKETLSDEYYNAIIAVWGEKPTAETTEQTAESEEI